MKRKLNTVTDIFVTLAPPNLLCTRKNSKKFGFSLVFL